MKRRRDEFTSILSLLSCKKPKCFSKNCAGTMPDLFPLLCNLNFNESKCESRFKALSKSFTVKTAVKRLFFDDFVMSCGIF